MIAGAAGLVVTLSAVAPAGIIETVAGLALIAALVGALEERSPTPVTAPAPA